MKKFFSEFKKFISRGNVMDMAVGMIVGASFTAIVNALSNGILKPLINMALASLSGNGDDPLKKAYTILKPGYVVDANGEKVFDLASSIYIDWGAFISSIINFLLIAFVLFIIVRAFNKVKNANEELKEKVRKNKKLSKKELAMLEEQKKKEQAEAAERERIAIEEANKLTRSEQLLTDIKELLIKNTK